MVLLLELRRGGRVRFRRRPVLLRQLRVRQRRTGADFDARQDALV